MDEHIQNDCIFISKHDVQNTKNKEPKNVIELYKEPKNQRKNVKWFSKYPPKHKNMQKKFVYKSLDIFYSLPHEIQTCKDTQFKRKLKKYINTTPLAAFDTMD